MIRSSNIDEDEFTLSNEDVFVDETVVGIELVQEVFISSLLRMALLDLLANVPLSMV